MSDDVVTIDNNDGRLEIPVKVEEVAGDTQNEDSPVTQSTQADEYKEYLKSKGINPDDLPSIVKLMKETDQRNSETTSHMRRLEQSFNNFVAKQQSTARQTEPLSEEELKKRWTKFAAMDPFQAMQEVTQSVTNAALMRDRLQSALDDLQEKYLEQEDGENIFNLHKNVALGLLQKDSAKYTSYNNPARSVRQLFKDAEVEVKKNAEFLLKVAGVQPNMTNPDATGDENESRSRQAMSAVMANALGPGSSTTSKNPATNDKGREKSIKDEYIKAFNSADVEKMMALKRTHPFLRDFSVMEG